MDSKIDFIYFDLGNVIVNFDHDRIGRNLAKLTGLSTAKANEIVFGTDIQKQYESGEISTTEFVEQVNQRAKSTISKTDMCIAVSDIFWLNRTTIPLITQLRSANIPIAILSNTCEAHWNFVLERFPVVKRFFMEFENILSFESRSMKPDNKIYDDAVAATGMDAASIFFMDDRVENVEAAKKRGMQSSVFQNAHQISNELYRLGIQINL